MMIELQVNTEDLNKLAVQIARITGDLPKQLSRSMNYAAYDAQKELRKQTPRYVDRPTPWTVNSTFVQKSTPENLALALGFKDTAVKGTPAAKFLQPLVGGQPRSQKPSERRLARSSAVFQNRYLVPTGKSPLTLDQYGNVPRGKMTQVLSRIKALESIGFTANASGSRRSRAKRRLNDFFIGYRANAPITINQRVGRGYVNVFNIVKQPKYQATFPVRSILQDKFNERFPSIFERLVFRSK
jgi:hypothetical protein